MGVKRATVYAYVSRGILSRRLALDGRTSLFDRAEVDALGQKGRNGDDRGLRVTLSTRITEVSDDGLLIRGRQVCPMVESGATFRDVVDLLWDTPDSDRVRWPDPVALARSLEELPTANSGSKGQRAPLGSDLLAEFRITTAILGRDDLGRHQRDAAKVRSVGRQLITAFACGPMGSRRTTTTDETDRAWSIERLLWHRLQPESIPTAEQLRALDMALALVADHGLAASTFAARVAASVRADPYSVVAAGMGALGGPLHGGASQRVHRVYAMAHGDAGEGQPINAVLDQLDEDPASPPGFGHSVYKRQDPRYGPLFAQMVKAWPGDPRLSTVFIAREQLGAHTREQPNVDLALGALTFVAGMPREAGEVIFTVARTAGWLAHALEEYEEEPLRLRPRARYIGESPVTG